MVIVLIAHKEDTPRHKVTGYLSGTYTAATVTNALATTTNAEASGFSAGGSTINPHAVLAAGVLTLTPGFTPKYVRVLNVTQRISKEWFHGMNAVDSLLTVAAGTQTLVTTGGVTVTADTVTGTAPVTLQPVSTITITFATDSLVTDNDTVVWQVEG